MPSKILIAGLVLILIVIIWHFFGTSAQPTYSLADSRLSISDGRGTLSPGQVLHSMDGRWRIVYQNDGNVIGYPTTSNIPFFSTGTNVLGNLTMQADGNAVVYDASGKPLWSSKSAPSGSSNYPDNPILPPYKFILQNDRNIVITNGNDVTTWSANTKI